MRCWRGGTGSGGCDAGGGCSARGGGDAGPGRGCGAVAGLPPPVAPPAAARLLLARPAAPGPAIFNLGRGGEPAAPSEARTRPEPRPPPRYGRDPSGPPPPGDPAPSQPRAAGRDGGQRGGGVGGAGAEPSPEPFSSPRSPGAAVPARPRHESPGAGCAGLHQLGAVSAGAARLPAPARRPLAQAQVSRDPPAPCPHPGVGCLSAPPAGPLPGAALCPPLPAPLRRCGQGCSAWGGSGHPCLSPCPGHSPAPPHGPGPCPAWGAPCPPLSPA